MGGKVSVRGSSSVGLANLFPEEFQNFNIDTALCVQYNNENQM